jgi:hypothetical protein
VAFVHNNGISRFKFILFFLNKICNNSAKCERGRGGFKIKVLFWGLSRDFWEKRAFLAEMLQCGVIFQAFLSIKDHLYSCEKLKKVCCNAQKNSF